LTQGRRRPAFNCPIKPPIFLPFTTARSGIAGAYRRFQFDKRGQLLIRMQNKAFTLAMRVNNPDRSPLTINQRI